MKINGYALYSKWNGADRNRWKALPEKSRAKWDALASMYGGGLSVNVTKLVKERIAEAPPKGSLFDRFENMEAVETDSPDYGGLLIADDQIAEKAEAFLRQAVDEALEEPGILEDPEVRALVTKLVLSRVSKTPLV